MGDELRGVYADIAMSCKHLASVLQQRRKSVEVSYWTCRDWYKKYAAPSSQASSSSCSRVLKRPAAKRQPAAHEVKVVSPAKALEAECGDRYRSEVSDKGLGLQRDDMVKRLFDWGIEASTDTCEEWIRNYRRGDGAKDGNASVFELSRQDLRRWYHVDNLSSLQLQQKYQEVYGVRAHRNTLYKWVTAAAQALDVFENNEDINAHPSGEYVLDQLQNGIAAEAVVDLLRERYLVQTSVSRVRAYRYYREQRGEYWTTDNLEREHWNFLYGQVTMETNLSRLPSQRTTCNVSRRLAAVRSSLAAHMQVSEEYIPLANLGAFFVRHQSHAKQF